MCEHKKKRIKIKIQPLLFSVFLKKYKSSHLKNIENAWNLIIKLPKIHIFLLYSLKIRLFELKKNQKIKYLIDFKPGFERKVMW